MTTIVGGGRRATLLRRLLIKEMGAIFSAGVARFKGDAASCASYVRRTGPLLRMTRQRYWALSTQPNARERRSYER